MTTNDRIRRNHRPSENWDECSLIFLGKEADVGMKGEALCQKKNWRSPSITTQEQSSTKHQWQRPRFNLPPITFRWLWNTLDNFFLPDVSKSRHKSVAFLCKLFCPWENRCICISKPALQGLNFCRDILCIYVGTSLPRATHYWQFFRLFGADTNISMRYSIHVSIHVLHCNVKRVPQFTKLELPLPLPHS